MNRRLTSVLGLLVLLGVTVSCSSRQGVSAVVSTTSGTVVATTPVTTAPATDTVVTDSVTTDSVT
ncbi:MAG: hypothetical protein WCC60_01025, partial [Ilumatobacteraceae bacterium]